MVSPWRCQPLPGVHGARPSTTEVLPTTSSHGDLCPLLTPTPDPLLPMRQMPGPGRRPLQTPRGTDTAAPRAAGGPRWVGDQRGTQSSGGWGQEVGKRGLEAPRGPGACPPLSSL